MAPQHTIWQRCRRRHHGGAIRSYAKPPSPRYGRTSPAYCEHCTRLSVLELSGCEREEEGEEGGWEGDEGDERRETQTFGDLLDDIDYSTGALTGLLGKCFNNTFNLMKFLHCSSLVAHQ